VQRSDIDGCLALLDVCCSVALILYFTSPDTSHAHMRHAGHINHHAALKHHWDGSHRQWSSDDDEIHPLHVDSAAAAAARIQANEKGNALQIMQWPPRTNFNFWRLH
jgi:hypothetical protein